MRYLVGIDLGTTNSAPAAIDLKTAPRSGRPPVEAFLVPQLVAAGELADRPLLPSFLYRPGPHELPAGATAVPWEPDATDAVGEFAREHGGKIPGRLVSSAKSWLCHPGVDRTAALLPWGAPPDVPRISPLEASARYLKHLVGAWNSRHSEKLETLPVVLTVPASFDDVARTLTVEAATQAGLTNVTLLEEPQAAFYCWQHVASVKEQNRLRAGMTCLVVDVGGGTTDFSLIAAVEEEGELRFVRQAVGDHLLLGGDNMDLALARFVEQKLPAGRLDALQFAALVQACRRAKEVLLGADPPESHPVTVVGRGRSVVGGTVSVPLTVADVQTAIFDGFFPIVLPGDAPTKPARAGLHEMGLPYVHDPAVTRHLAQFLGRHGGVSPDAILFNGGVFQPAALRQRLLDAMGSKKVSGTFSGAEKVPDTFFDPMVLTTPSLDLAVGYGAAAYAWLRHTGGRAIGGGTARSYYIEVQHDDAPAGVPVLCVVPRHLEENEEVVLAEPELDLALGEPILFPLYTSTARDDKAGDVLTVQPDQLKKLPPLSTVLRGGKRGTGGPKTVPVTLAARTTAIGTLELYCVAKSGGHRWRLEFSTRDASTDDDESNSPSGERQIPGIVLSDAVVQPAADLIRATFLGDGPPPKELPKALEAILDGPRDQWPTALCRRLWEPLAEAVESRRRSPAHTARWYNLVGFCLRPGFGDPLDRYRVDTLWKLLHAPVKKVSGTFSAAEKVPDTFLTADAWIMWRRIAGGLTAAFQKTLYDRLRPALLPAKGKASFKPGANELAEMWRAAAALERLDVKQKTALGDALVKQVKTAAAPTYAFWSLTRLGARELLYGPLNAVVHPETASGWLDALLPYQPAHDSDRIAWSFCLAQLARRSGQRALDVDDSRRASVKAALKSADAPAAWRQMIDEVTGRSVAEKAQIFGDSLPVGLRLRA